MTVIVALSGSGNWTVPGGITQLDHVLVLGGGGGGGASYGFQYPGGGGGAGQLRVLTSVSVTPGASISYSVGTGGVGGAEGGDNNGLPGGNTVFGATTSVGGGGGGASDAGGIGGSGGGGGAAAPGGTAADALYGNDGGAGYTGAAPWPGGGGGGAGVAGQDGIDGGAGGAGVDLSATFGTAYGVSGWFAGGGSGGVYDDALAAQAGGTGGGGAASDGTGGWSGGNAVASTGSGGAGAGADDLVGGSGGNGSDGIILIAYTVPEFVDWAGDIDANTSQTYYACEIDDGVLDAIRPPISSWQATVQTDRASYAQAVIPAATDWVSAISDRADGEFVIYRGVRYPDGTTQESELARAPLGDVRFDVGPTNATMTISGYGTTPPPSQALTRTLRNVRSESTANGLFRVRCDIDWFLRPGHTAVSRGTEFTVAYVNYYVNSSDQYMDAGERAL